MNDHAGTSRGKNAAHGRRAFAIHLIAFLLVNALLIAINLATSSGHLWFQWPLLGWGIGIVAHGFVTFALPGRKTE